MKKFQVYGDYGLDSEQLLEDFDLRSEAERWATQYARHDLGGYATVEVVSFRDCGEVVTHLRFDSEAMV
jgi:hypothetical protein